MIFYDMDKISENIGETNKYMTTYVVAHRARQLSELRKRPMINEEIPAEKFVSQALEELEQDDLNVRFIPTPSEVQEHELES